MYLVDTSAWVEIFRGTQNGGKFAELISTHNSYVTGIILAEISKWCWANSLDVNLKISQIEKMSNGIVESGRVSELRAGFFWAEANNAARKKERDVGLIDCLIAAVAEENGLTVLTKDRHFARFAQVKKEML